MRYNLPTSVTVGGAEYPIRSDFRAVLDLFEAVESPELSEAEKVRACLCIFYPNAEDIPHRDIEEAVRECFRFINGGELEQRRGKSPKLVSWPQDLPFIIAPINRVVGQDVRGMEYLHWWTFLSAYYEIGDCLFAQIVRIRSKKAKGQRLDKEDAKWYRENRALVDIKTRTTSAEDEVLKAWGV